MVRSGSCYKCANCGSTWGARSEAGVSRQHVRSGRRSRGTEARTHDTCTGAACRRRSLAWPPEQTSRRLRAVLRQPPKAGRAPSARLGPGDALTRQPPSPACLDECRPPSRVRILQPDQSRVADRRIRSPGRITMDLELDRQDRHRHRVQPRARPGERHGAGQRRAAASRCARAAPSGSPRRPREVRAPAATPDRVSPSGRPGDGRGHRGRRRADGSSTSAASTSSSTTSAWRAARDLLGRPTPTGRRRSTRRCSRPSARRGWPCPHMRARGGGVILMIASIFGRETGGRMTYNAVKAAEISLAKSLAQQLAPRQHPRQQRRAGVDPVSGRLVVEAAAGRPRGHRRLRAPRTAVRPLRHPRGSRQRRRVSGVAEGQLDRRRQHRRGRLPVAVAVLSVTGKGSDDRASRLRRRRVHLRPRSAPAAPHRRTSSSAAARPGSTPRPTTARCCATCGPRCRSWASTTARR